MRSMMTEKEILVYIIIPFGITIVSTILFAIFRWLKSKISKDRLKIKEIKSIADKDINGFIELYNNRIADNVRICAEQIVGFIDPDLSDKVFHHLYILKNKDKVVGFIKFMISKINDYLFIAYIAIDKSDCLAVNSGVKIMIDKVIKKYVSGRKGVKNIYTEIERGTNNGYITALSKAISRRINAYKLHAYILKFDYIQPNMPDDNYGKIKERILTLIWIPNYEISKKFITKRETINLCKMLYEDIYLPSCKCSNCCDSYGKYLENICKTYNQNVNRRIELLPLNNY